MNGESRSDTGFQPVRASGILPVQSLAHFVPYFHDKGTAVSQRNLPHWIQEGATYFLTWRLADSLPVHLNLQWSEEREIWLRYHPKPWSGKDAVEYNTRFTQRRQDWLDQGYGECWLKNPAGCPSRMRKLWLYTVLSMRC